MRTTTLARDVRVGLFGAYGFEEIPMNAKVSGGIIHTKGSEVEVVKKTKDSVIVRVRSGHEIRMRPESVTQ